MEIKSDGIDDHIWELMLEPQPNSLGEVSRMNSVEILGHEIYQNLSLLQTESTGGVVWQTTSRMIHAIRDKTHPLHLKLSGRSVIELGCGTGALALTVNDITARWVASDQHSLMKLAQKNLEGCENVELCEFDWELHDWNTPVDPTGIVVGCDLIYNEYLINPLVASLRSIFDATGISEALIANQLRDPDVLSAALTQFCRNFHVEYLGNLGPLFVGYPVYLLRSRPSESEIHQQN